MKGKEYNEKTTQNVEKHLSWGTPSHVLGYFHILVSLQEQLVWYCVSKMDPGHQVYACRTVWDFYIWPFFLSKYWFRLQPNKLTTLLLSFKLVISFSLSWKNCLSPLLLLRKWLSNTFWNVIKMWEELQGYFAS